MVGEIVSLYPSIGNCGFKCKSHYWITNNKIRFARKWSNDEITELRNQVSIKSKKYYSKRNKPE